MQRLFYWAFTAFWLACFGAAQAGEYRLLDGDIFRGQPVSYNEEGVVLSLEVGGYSPRISWGKLTQESLKELVKDPKAAPFAEPFIFVPPEVKAKERAKRREVPIRDVPRIERPLDKKVGFAALFSTPIGIFIAALLYLANLFAAYETAVYRGRSPALVCGISALLPVVGPIVFLSLPPQSGSEADAPTLHIPDPTDAAAPVSPMAATGTGSSLSVAAAKKTGPAATMDGAVFKRSDTTFNRRFFETKFAGFFRIVPSEAEKDLVLIIRGTKHEYAAKRVSRISSTDLHVQLLRGGTEVSIPFAEIAEVQVRHKDKIG